MQPKLQKRLAACGGRLLIAGIAAWSVYAQQIWVGGGRGYTPRWPKLGLRRFLDLLPRLLHPGQARAERQRLEH